MRQNINQNIDLPQPNSLQKDHPKFSLSTFKLPRHPKILLLLFFSLSLLILLSAFIFTSKNRTGNPSSNQPSLQPEKVINTIIPASDFTQKINQIEIDINSGTLLEPPLIDDQIGL